MEEELADSGHLAVRTRPLDRCVFASRGRVYLHAFGESKFEFEVDCREHLGSPETLAFDSVVQDYLIEADAVEVVIQHLCREVKK